MAQRYRELAERIVFLDLKSETKTDKEKTVFKKKLKAQVEKEERIKNIEFFMNNWNKWRLYFYDLGEIQPKTKSQVTQIENIINWAEENRIDIDMLCAVVHRAHIKKSFRPSFSTVIAYGQEWLEKFQEEIESKVLEELAESERENRARYNESY